MKNVFLFIGLILISSGAALAQVGIGTEAPHSSAALEVKSSSKGILTPRMSQKERENIKDPAMVIMMKAEIMKARAVFDRDMGRAAMDWVNKN